MRFRLGAHDLPVATGRWKGQERSQRLCPLCQSAELGDEFHMVFECPFYNGVRERFSDLFVSFGGFEIPISATTPSGAAMRAFMGQNTRMVAAFVHYCWLLRSGRAPCLQYIPELDESELESISDDELLSVL